MTLPKNKESAEIEVRLQQSMGEYRKKKKTGKNESLRCVARDSNVNFRQTLQNQLNGMQSRNKAQKHSVQLRDAKEKELVPWIKTITQPWLRSTLSYSPRNGVKHRGATRSGLGSVREKVFVITELQRILKVEWLAAFVEAYENALIA
jgi:hypothetical protein